MYNEELLLDVSVLEDLLSGHPINREKLSDKEYAKKQFKLNDYSERVMDVYICGNDYDNTAWSFSPDKFKDKDDYLWTINHNKRYFHFLEIFESKKALI